VSQAALPVGARGRHEVRPTHETQQAAPAQHDGHTQLADTPECRVPDGKALHKSCSSGQGARHRIARWRRRHLRGTDHGICEVLTITKGK